MRKLVTLASLLLLLGGLFYLRPPFLGGSVTYVMVSGVSMLPTLEEGDLVVATKPGSYAVGDVVAYQSPGGPLVIHRILGRDGDAFTFQGDNNDFVDPWIVGPDEIAGKAILFAPGLGALFSFLRSPLRIAIVVGVLSLYISLAGLFLSYRPWGSRERRSRQRMRISKRRQGLALW